VTSETSELLLKNFRQDVETNIAAADYAHGFTIGLRISQGGGHGYGPGAFSYYVVLCAHQPNRGSNLPHGYDQC
jgi:hypothetical protein